MGVKNEATAPMVTQITDATGEMPADLAKDNAIGARRTVVAESDMI